MWWFHWNHVILKVSEAWIRGQFKDPVRYLCFHGAVAVPRFLTSCSRFEHFFPFTEIFYKFCVFCEFFWGQKAVGPMMECAFEHCFKLRVNYHCWIQLSFPKMNIHSVDSKECRENRKVSQQQIFAPMGVEPRACTFIALYAIVWASSLLVASLRSLYHDLLISKKILSPRISREWLYKDLKVWDWMYLYLRKLDCVTTEIVLKVW